MNVISISASRKRKSGQALVELALAATLLGLLFMAAVDAGLAYRSYQTLVNASAEATSFLAQNPYAGDPATIAGADTIATTAFKEEQGGSREGTSSSSATIDIKAADSNQVFIGTGGVYGVADSFSGANSSACKDRQNADGDGKPCYIVVRSSVVYRPFMLTPFFGSAMTIRTVSVKPIVGYPVVSNP